MERNLEGRVSHLEAQITQLRDELRATRRAGDKDWRRTIGMFTDDSGMQDILSKAMHAREADRRRAGRKPPKRRGRKP